MAKKAKKTARKKTTSRATPTENPLLSRVWIATQAQIPWDHVALAVKVMGISQGDPGWEAAAAAQSARLSFLWADAMILEAGK